MPTSWRLLAGFASVLLLSAACGDPQPTLVVDLRTDFVAGFEFTEVRAELSLTGGVSMEADVVERDSLFVTEGEDFTLGERIAEFDTGTGTRWVTVELFAPDGTLLARRPAQIDVTDDMGIVVVITRDCGDVECPAVGGNPAHLACLAGECVDTRCRPGALEFCGDLGCASDADCGGVAECAASRCLEGICYASAIPGACEVGEWCHPDLGCVAAGGSPDAGPMCRRVACDLPNECDIGLLSCDEERVCERAGSAFTGRSCAEGECDGGGSCRGFLFSVTATGRGTIVSDPAGLRCGETCAARFTRGDRITLTAIADEGASFVEWIGDACAGQGASCVVEAVEAGVEVEARFAADLHTLAVAPNGEGAGTISGADGGIDCGATCTTEVRNGDTVTLAAIAAPGSTFLGWGGACTGPDPSCTFTVTGDAELTATFVIGAYNVIVVKSGTGEGTVTSADDGINCGVTCAASYERDARVLLTATPAPGSRFVGWSGDCTGRRDCSLTVSGPRTAGALFERIQHTLTVDGSEGGTVASVPAGLIDCGEMCTALVDEGTSVNLVATPSSGFEFTGWSGACRGSSIRCEVEVSGAVGVGATFGRAAQTLRVAADGGGEGTITTDPAGIDCGETCMASFPFGARVELTATPNVGSRFTGWSGSCRGDGGCVVEMAADREATATFAVATYPVTVAATGDGRITASAVRIDCGLRCSAIVDHGTRVTFSAVALGDNELAGWGGACAFAGSAPTCTVSITSATDVSAAFVPPSESVLTVRRTGSGSVRSAPAGIDCGATCAASYVDGTSVTLTATPSTGARFVRWTGACSGSGACVVSVDEDVEVGAEFEPLMFTVTIEPPTGGTGGGLIQTSDGILRCGPVCTREVEHGTVVTFQARPDSASTFDGFTGDCSGTRACTLEVTSDVTVGGAFTLVTYTLDVAVEGRGTGNVVSADASIRCPGTCSAEYAAATMVTLRATPASGSAFTGWSGGGCSGTGSCTVRMDAATGVTATFGLRTFDVCIRATGGGVGTISGAPGRPVGDCSLGAGDLYQYGFGERFTLTATPEEGSVFSGWSGGTCSGTEPTCVVTVSDDASIFGQFELDDVVERFTLTTANETVGGEATGTITGEGIACGRDCRETYDDGTRVTLVATPFAGSVFAGWTGACRGSGATCLLTITRDANATARWEPETEEFPLSVTIDGEGAVMSLEGMIACPGECTGRYAEGTNVTLRALGEGFSRWAGDCTGTIPSCTVAMSSAREVTAVFGDIDLCGVNVIIEKGGAGTVSGPGIACPDRCSASLECGTEAVMVATPGRGMTTRWLDPWCSETARGDTCVLPPLSDVYDVRVRFFPAF